MMTFVVLCCFVYVFISFGRCTASGIEDYSNDSPGILPKIVTFRYRAGSDITLKCNNHHFPKMKITWEYKPCEINYNGIHCNHHLYNWYKLDRAYGRRKLEIANSNETNSGVYRCLYDDIILKIYVLEIVVLAKYQGPPPRILSLISTDYTVEPNSHITIICNTTSAIRPEIRWFRQCIGKRCDIYDNNICFCTITMQKQQYQQQNPIYPIDNFTYLSKLNIYNIRNIDSGIYVCLVFSVYGKDYKSVKINVIESKLDGISTNIDDTNTFPLLFLIPLAFVLIPISIWLCYLKKKTNNFIDNNVNTIQEQQRQLIKPIVKVDIVVDKNETI